TKDYATTLKLGESLEAGTVCINHGAVNTNYAPYAGWKDSGYGIELSRRAVNADSHAAITDCLEAARECGAPIIIETSLWQLTGRSFGGGDAILGLAR